MSLQCTSYIQQNFLMARLFGEKEHEDMTNRQTHFLREIISKVRKNFIDVNLTKPHNQFCSYQYQICVIKSILEKGLLLSDTLNVKQPCYVLRVSPVCSIPTSVSLLSSKHMVYIMSFFLESKSQKILRYSFYHLNHFTSACPCVYVLTCVGHTSLFHQCQRASHRGSLL